MEIFRCDCCDYETKFKSNLTRHKKVHFKPKEEPESDQTICVLCCKQFSDKYKCRRHMENNCKVARDVPNVSIVDPNVSIVDPNVSIVDPNVSIVDPNVSIDDPNISTLDLKCNRCYKTFTTQSNLNRHIQKQRCQSIKHPLECYKCHKVLSSLQTKSRHQKTCKGLVTNTLSVPPPAGIVTQNNIQTQNNYNNDHCNYTQNIYINNFGAENLSHVSKEFLDNCLLNLRRGVCDYIEKVNFNPDVPENHNIRYEDTRSVKVKESDNTWRLRNIEPTVESLIKHRCRELETHYKSNDEIKVMDTNVHFNIIRDHLQYLMMGVKKEMKPVLEYVVSLVRELEKTYAAG